MANKKKKNSAVFDSVINDVAKEERVSIAPTEEIVLNNNAFSDTGIKTTEEVSKEDLIEKLQNENAELSKNNSELLEKLAEYIEKANAQKETPVVQVSNNTQELENTISKLTEDLKKVTSEKDILQTSIDKYLVRISELSFENAKLRSDLTNKSNNNLRSCEGTVRNTMNGPIFPRNNIRSNGYEGWN